MATYGEPPCRQSPDLRYTTKYYGTLEETCGGRANRTVPVKCARLVRADVSKDAGARGLVDLTMVGVGRLDVAVNNAGTESNRGSVTERSAESYAAGSHSTCWAPFSARSTNCA
jgi:NAD(P)-dependent dehydrogenase (short-subunit alcohol dehydrogenase family)